MMDQQSQAWHEWRRKGIGGSDAPVVMGVSPYKTPYQLWEEKTGKANYDQSNWATRRGNDLEPRARAIYELINDAPMPADLVVNSKIEYIRASLDGHNKELKRGLEIKFQGIEDHELARDGKVPPKYWPQLQHQILAADLLINDFASFNDTVGTLHVVSVEPDLKYIESLKEAEAIFWELVQKQTPPDLTDKDFKMVRDKEVSQLFEDWRVAKLQSDMADSKLKDLKKLIESKLDHPRVRCGDVRVMKIEKAGSIDYSKIDILKTIDLEAYRKKPIIYFDFRIQKEKASE